jgi:hypothetical protein
MAITFLYGSGSAPAWRVWLALEAKGPWEKRSEALPYLAKTWPPHWKA